MNTGTRKNANEQQNKTNKTKDYTKEKTSKNSEPGEVLRSKIIRTIKPRKDVNKERTKSEKIKRNTKKTKINKLKSFI